MRGGPVSEEQLSLALPMPVPWLPHPSEAPTPWSAPLSLALAPPPLLRPQFQLLIPSASPFLVPLFEHPTVHGRALLVFSGVSDLSFPYPVLLTTNIPAT